MAKNKAILQLTKKEIGTLRIVGRGAVIRDVEDFIEVFTKAVQELNAEKKSPMQKRNQ